MGPMTIVLLAISAILAAIGIWVMMAYNRLVGLRNESDQGWSNIEAQLQRRADLIPNMVAVVKGYAGFEGDVLERVTAARSAIVGAGDISQMAMADLVSRQAIGGFMGHAEAYPELKASEEFQHLQVELSRTEDLVASSRRMYNVVVRSLNDGIQSLPTSLIAGPLGFTPREYYRLEDDGERAVPSASIAGGGVA